MKELSFTKLGKNITAARKSVGISQQNLSISCGLNEQIVGQIERGLKKPSLETAYRIATILGTTVDALIGR